MLIQSQTKNRVIDAVMVSVDHYDDKNQVRIYTIRGRDASGNTEVLGRYNTREEAQKVAENLATKFKALWIKEMEK
jgi:hypothetical protein